MALKINEISGMPQMKLVFSDWQKAITLTKITQEIEGGFVNEVETDCSFIGIIQPLSPKQIALKPEGQRAFTWIQIHCEAGKLNLDVNDRIIYNNKNYKIMAMLNYSLNNFIEYHSIEDYQNE